MINETKPLSPEEIVRLLKNYELHGKNQFHREFPFEQRYPHYEMPFHSKFHKTNPEFDKMFKDFKISILSGVPDDKPQMEGHLYHGTSLDALDSILEDGHLHPPIVLIKRGKIVSGELKTSMDRDKNQGLNGPKFMSRDAMIKSGLLTPDDPNLYIYGHAGDVFFEPHLIGALHYADTNPEKRAAIGIRQSVAELHGAKFINTGSKNGSEGILHEGSLCLHMPLSQLFVPRARVEEYQERAKANYLLQVYPVEEMTLENLTGDKQ